MESYQAGDIENALSAARRARETDPSLAAAHELEALLHADLGNRDQHVAALRRVIDAQPASPQLQNSVGRMLIEAGEREEGLAAMRQAVRLAPRDARFARDLAGVYLEDGDLTTAAAVLTAAQLHNPADSSLSVALARLYETAGDWRRACDHYRLVLEREPRNAVWRRQHAKCLYRLQNFPLAASEFQRSLETDVAVLSVTDRIEFGDACLWIGDVERARWLFDQLVEQGHDTREVCVLRGVCALRSNNPVLAEQIFTQAIARWPDDPSLELLLNNSRLARSSVVPAAGERPALRNCLTPAVVPAPRIDRPQPPVTEPPPVADDAQWLPPLVRTQP